MKERRTDIVVPLDAKISVIRQTSFEDVEAIMAARFDVAQSLTHGAHGHPHDGSHTFTATIQLCPAETDKS